jgi:hypothetical protein
MSSFLSPQEQSYIKQLMLLSCLRGMDGSGAFVIRPHKNKLKIEVKKTEFSAAELAVDPEFDDMLRQPKIIVSHARAPTRGDAGLGFVHPHRVQNITGVHNGTMHTVMGKSIDQKASDSRAVFEAIQEFGVEEFIKNSRGAYSLVWADIADMTLNFLRNDQRPMFMARIGTNVKTDQRAHTMYFASEMGMLKYVLHQRGTITEANTAWVSPKPWQHVKFKLDVSYGIAPVSLKEYEDPFKVGSYSNWSKEYEDAWSQYEQEIDKKQDMSGVQGVQSVIPLPDRTRETTSRNTNYRGTTGHDVLRERLQHNGILADSRFLPRVEEILSRRHGRHVNKPETFQRVNDDAPDELLIKTQSCVICDELVKLENGRAPKIHRVKFGDHAVPQFICDGCVQSKNPLAVTVLGSQLAIAGHA